MDKAGIITTNIATPTTASNISRSQGSSCSTLLRRHIAMKDPAYAKMVRTFIAALIAGERAAVAQPAGSLAILKKVTQYTPQFLALSTPESLKLIKPSPGTGWDCLNIPQLQQLANFMTSEKIITGHVDVAQEATNAYNSAC